MLGCQLFFFFFLTIVGNQLEVKKKKSSSLVVVQERVSGDRGISATCWEKNRDLHSLGGQ